MKSARCLFRGTLADGTLRVFRGGWVQKLPGGSVAYDASMLIGQPRKLLVSDQNVENWSAVAAVKATPRPDPAEFSISLLAGFCADGAVFVEACR